MANIEAAAIAADKAKKAWELYLTGWTMVRIAEEIGSSKSAVHRFIKRTLEEHAADTKDIGRAYIEAETKRLDEMLEIYKPMALAGDLGAGELVLKIQARRAKYLGLDMPTELKHSGEIGIESLILKTPEPKSGA